MSAPRTLRHQLRTAGFCPIPLYGKEPPAYGKNNKRKGLSGWQELHEVTPEQIDIWDSIWPDAVNTGALTRLMPTLDLDILNPEAAEAAEALVRERYEERGYILVRIGLPPKRAVPFRTQEPFDKIVVNLVAPNWSPEKKSEKIEFLSDGQQVVVDGIHPDTKQPYRWFGGEPGQIKLEEPMVRGSVRNGSGLLVGLLRCGHCGRKLKVHHNERKGARYVCTTDIANLSNKNCIAFSNMRIDAAMSAEVLRAVSPLAMEAALQLIADHEQAGARQGNLPFQ
jgi:hypothetical protein